MKPKISHIFVVAVAAIIILFQTANAQNNAPYWSLQGNNNAVASSKLGTLNTVPLKIYAGNVIRMNINHSTGNVSIGTAATASASYRLYVKGTSYGIYGTGSIYGIVGSGGSYGVYGSGTTSGLYGYSGGTYGVYGSGGNYGFYGHSTNGYGGQAVSDNSDGFDAYTTNGYYGVYASSPNYYGVYGYGGNTGLYGYGGTYGTYGYGATTGAYGYSYSGTGLQGESYDGYGAYIHSTNSYGLVSSTDYGTWAGVFYGYVYSSGGYTTSDKNLKKNIQEFGNAMSIINKLKPKFYEFKDDAKYKSLSLPKGTHYGLLAQDLEQVLPNLVKESEFKLPNSSDPLILKPKTKDGKDENVYQKTATTEKTESITVKAVNYEELIPVMVKAMQEQNDRIETLSQQVNSLLSSKQSAISNNTTSEKLTSTNFIGQVAPNPAKTATSIYYNNLPNNAKAQMFISDVNGKMIKQMQLSNHSGFVTVDVSALSAGIYTCSLLLNGRLMESKKIEVAK